MSLLFMDSFDGYVTADRLEKWTTLNASGTGSSLTISATAGRRSSGGLRWVTGSQTNPTGWMEKVLAPVNATVIVGVSFSTSGTAGSAGLQIVTVKHTTTTQVYVRLNTDMTLSVLRGPHGTGTVLGTTSSVLTPSTHTYLELKVLIATSGGTVDLRINNVSVLSLTGQNTQQSGSAVWTGIVLGLADFTNNTNSATRNLDWDDLYVLDGSGSAPWNDFLGDCRVDALRSTAPGATTGWTPSTGANWQNVDDAAPDDDTTYNSATTSGLTDTFTFQDAPVVGGTILGVQHNLSMKKGDAGTGTMAPVVRHSGTDNVGSSLSLGTSYAYGLQINQTNPGTGLAWTEADFNAAEFGYKRLT